MARIDLYKFFKKSNCVIGIGIIWLVLTGYLLLDNSSLCRHLVDKINRSSENSNEVTSPTRVLIIYVYARTHVLSEDNLKLFIRTSVSNIHDADYYFILQQFDNITIDETTLPMLPYNAHYIQHENECYDTGIVGWFLSQGIVNKNKYRYFIFLNSSVRGPFIVSYYDSLTWYTIFTRRLNDHVKLVGCTISCQVAAHVQSYLWALDLKGLNLLLDSGTVFSCHKSMHDAINKAEIDASQIILKSGFGIDSLMKKYQNIDFREEKNKKCNNMQNPTFNKKVDGISLDPFEIVFVKVKDGVAVHQDNQERVTAYEKWMH